MVVSSIVLSSVIFLIVFGKAVKVCNAFSQSQLHRQFRGTSVDLFSAPENTWNISLQYDSSIVNDSFTFDACFMTLEIIYSNHYSIEISMVREHVYHDLT